MIDKHMDVLPKSLTSTQRPGQDKKNILKRNISGTIHKFPLTNNPSYAALYRIAIDFINQCYQQQQPSKELIRGFFKDLEHIRSEYI